MKQCPQCRKRIDNEARICPYCQSIFSEQEVQSSIRAARVRGMVGFAIVLAIGIGLIKSCGI